MRGWNKMTVEKTADLKIEVQRLEDITKTIRERDGRKNNTVLGRELFNQPGKINNCINGNVSLYTIRSIRGALEDYARSMKDYSSFPEEALINSINSMLDQKGYKKAEVSKAMGFSGSAVSTAISQKFKPTLITIYEYVSQLLAKEYLNTITENPLNKATEKAVNEVAEKPKEPKIVAKVGEMYVNNWITLEGVVTLRLTRDIEKSAPMEEQLDNPFLKRDIAVKFVKVKEVTQTIEEEL